MEVKRKKIGLTVLVILLVTGLIAGVYWFFFLNKETKTSTSFTTTSAGKDETSGWKTYETENFSFNYPPDWKIEKGEGVKVRLNSPGFDSNIPSQSEPVEVIKKGTTIKFLSPQDYSSSGDLAQYLNDIGHLHFYSIGVGVLSETTLDGESGLKYDTKLGVYSVSENYIRTSYFVVHDGKIYQVGRLYVSGKQSEYEETFNKILETFKFLE